MPINDKISCDCFVGTYFDGEEQTELYLTEYQGQLKGAAEYENFIGKTTFGDKHKKVEPLDYFKEGWADWYTYCPRCGRKIDKQELYESLKKTLDAEA